MESAGGHTAEMLPLIDTIAKRPDMEDARREFVVAATDHTSVPRAEAVGVSVSPWTRQHSAMRGRAPLLRFEVVAFNGCCDSRCPISRASRCSRSTIRRSTLNLLPIDRFVRARRPSPSRGTGSTSSRGAARLASRGPALSPPRCALWPHRCGPCCRPALACSSSTGRAPACRWRRPRCLAASWECAPHASSLLRACAGSTRSHSLAGSCSRGWRIGCWCSGRNWRRSTGGASTLGSRCDRVYCNAWSQTSCTEHGTHPRVTAICHAPRASCNETACQQPRSGLAGVRALLGRLCSDRRRLNVHDLAREGHRALAGGAVAANAVLAKLGRQARLVRRKGVA